MPETFVVICRADRNEDGTPGRYELAIRTVFYTDVAATTYAAGVPSSREPMIVPGDWNSLRPDAMSPHFVAQRLVTAKGGRGTYPALLQTLPEFQDISWGNDVFDSIVVRARGNAPYRVWVANEDPSEREPDFEDVKRFSVWLLVDHGVDTWGENQDASDEPAYETDDPGALAAWLMNEEAAS